MTRTTKQVIDADEELLDVRTANEWLRAAKGRPVPKKLFGPMWLEGELAIMFADTAKGKSLLAVQIAESIARGYSPPFLGGVAAASADGAAAPLAMEARPQTVLYFDFELSDKQFEMRYAGEHNPKRGDFLKGHYRFSDRFRRVEISLNARLPGDFPSFDEYLLAEIERLVRRTRARIVIIDNITYLKRTNDGTRDAVSLIKRLRKLKRQYGLSILALAHTARRGHDRPITVGDLQGSKVLANFADNIFAIGQSRLDAATRYIKHLKPRSSAMKYDAGSVLSFRIGWQSGNFLGFEYLGTASEAEHLDAGLYTADREAVTKIKELSDDGMSIRAIAAELGLSKSKVHRLLHLWTTDDEESDESGVWSREAEDEDEDEDGSDEAESETPGLEDGVVEAEGKDEWKPRKEEYRGQHTDNYLVSIGVRPVWKEKWEAEARALGNVDEADARETTAEIDPKIDPDPAPYTPRSALGGLRRSTDAYGREILVESEDANGKPMIWYQTNPKGQKFRHQRKGFTVITEAVVA
ncbi:MAG TPA: AAA family ATPase [Pyrinomonadaceae bacterium]|nr:AAA family ATPase [Pyrinomonadaceae bacterium]